MNFLFYDTETTGVNVAFDQIVQFAAIVMDENFVELDRLNIRCRLLPWIVPSPVALLVTKTSPENLTNPDLPSHFEMMAEIRDWLEKWKPAIFIGYNSIKFDEILLHRAFWHTLNPPYVSVTNGNSRFDLLPIIRALSVSKPESIETAFNDENNRTFKLDKLAPANGYNAHNAHDALGDVEATIFLARKIAERAPEFWETLTSRTSKSDVSSALAPEKPVYVLDSSPASPRMRWAQRIDHRLRTSDATLAYLDCDWGQIAHQLEDDNQPSESSYTNFLRTVSLNKSPVFFTIDEAEKLFSASPKDNHILNSEFLKSTNLPQKLAESPTRRAAPHYERLPELEETIYEAFASKSDIELMKKFQQSSWPERSNVSSLFSDRRFRRLATRILYVSAPDQLSEKERSRMDLAIHERLNTPLATNVPWRSIAKAQAELLAAKKQWGGDEAFCAIEHWISSYHH